MPRVKLPVYSEGPGPAFRESRSGGPKDSPKAGGSTRVRVLEQILCELRREGLLESRRGAHGGYRFAMPPEEISVLDVVEILDGAVRPARCSAGGGCYMTDAPLCVTSKVWDEAREALESVFGRYSIAQLAETERESRAGREAAHATK